MVRFKYDFLLIFAIPLLVFLGCTQNGRTTDCVSYGSRNPSAPSEIIQYGRFVGAWGCTVSNLQGDGTWMEKTANWEFRYILDGYAIQDFWISPGEAEEGKNQYLGTNIRIFDPSKKTWQCSWTENGANTMSGIWESLQDEDGNLLLYDDTQTWEIKFYNITENSFDWQWNFKQEDGSWQVQSKIKARRTC